MGVVLLMVNSVKVYSTMTVRTRGYPRQPASAGVAGLDRSTVNLVFMVDENGPLLVMTNVNLVHLVHRAEGRG